MTSLKNVTEEEQICMDGSSPKIEEEYISIQFQCGPIQEKGVNGIQITHVLELLAARLEGFQKNETFSCSENEMALLEIKEAITWLEIRTRDRVKRGVEGRNIQ